MPENNPSFSVVIPVYNGGLYIKAAIESCLQQTVLPNEIIVIDDGSEDDTGSVIAGIHSDLIVYKKNEKNQGPSFSRNIGLKLARYSWILFLDADDLFHKQKIEITRYCISLDESVKAIGHSFNRSTDAVFNPGENWQEKILLKKKTVRQVLLTNPVVTPSLAVAATNGLLFNETMSYAEDHDFILRTTEQVGVWYFDMPLSSLVRLPLTPGGISADKWKMRKGEISMYIDYCKRNGLTLAIPFLVMFSLIKHIKTVLLD
jgi:teichuronic acid biosynthesis glycosyltransferase TuaG